MICNGDCKNCGKCLRDGTKILSGVKLPKITPDKGIDSDELGLAVDIGTTTVVAYLLRLKTCEIIGTAAGHNVQREYGGDVVGRLKYCMEHGHKKLHEAIRAQVEGMREELLKKADGGKITRVAVAGNTIMQHLYAGLSPVGMANVPFEPVSLFGETIDGIYYCPCISSYVGGDITAGLLACEYNGLEEGDLLIDIGTNGEMALKTAKGFVSCAVAAGPAFEGGEISCGAPASEGVCDHVYFKDGNITYSVIGEDKENGICGSGLVDLLACLLDMELVDESGYMEEPFYLKEGVTVTPGDIRKLQLAKASFEAGIKVLSKLPDMPKIKRIYLAGGFAAYMRLISSRRIGLVPDGIDIVPAGHTAGIGVCLALLSQKERNRLKEIRESCKLEELSGSPAFSEAFMEAMIFM